MRILLATDASRSADRARDLVASLALPAGSVIRVVAVLRQAATCVGPPLAATFALEDDDLERRQVHTLETALESAVHAIGRRDVKVERMLLTGRPASAILEEAREFEADLIVVGSRGHGMLESMLLGSVSAEVVDHAPCPVLVVRDAVLDSILLAEDGSASAAKARDVVSSWPIFRHLPVTVLTVAETERLIGGAWAPGVTGPVIEAWTDAIDENRERAAALASRAGEEIGGEGRTVTAVVSEGDPAHEIVEAARERKAGLIVAGTRGHTGIKRLVLGSVARNVLLHAPCSVLIVREKAQVRHEEPADEVAARA
jgi:nucleotide-binding universal stress UspA family protein